MQNQNVTAIYHFIQHVRKYDPVAIKNAKNKQWKTVVLKRNTTCSNVGIKKAVFFLLNYLDLNEYNTFSANFVLIKYASQ